MAKNCQIKIKGVKKMKNYRKPSLSVLNPKSSKSSRGFMSSFASGFKSMFGGVHSKNTNISNFKSLKINK